MAAKKRKQTRKWKSVRSFTVVRSKWLHGEDSVESKLLRKEDEKQCCLGFYLEACGFSRKNLVNKCKPSELDVKRVPSWLVGNCNEREAADSSESSALMAANDDRLTAGGYLVSERVREAKIVRLFKKQCIKAIFVD